MVAANLALIALAGYLAGSIPTSVWLSKGFFGFDIREKGSGNAGGTNAWRVLGWKAAVFVVMVDIGKGYVATALLSRIRLAEVDLDPTYTALVAGVAAVLGHVWTLFAGFRGGKGIATMGGMLIALYPAIVPICLLIFFSIAFATRYVSLASLCAVSALPVGLAIAKWVMKQSVSTPLILFAFVLWIFVFYTHRSNIRRLLAGTENRIGAPKSAA